MKNYLKSYSKRFVSVFLSVLMLLSCWVWISPTADAYSGETYKYFLVYKCTDDQDDDEVFITFKLYYKPNYGKGDLTYKSISCSASWMTGTCTHAYSSDGGTYDGISTSKLDLGVGSFPMYAWFRFKRTNATITRNCAAQLQLKVYNKAGTCVYDSGECKDSANSQECNIALNTSRGTGFQDNESQGSSVPTLPYLSPVWTTVWSTSAELNPSATSTAATTAEFVPKDQYGYTLPGSTNYSISAKVPDNKDKAVSASFAYLTTTAGTASTATQSAVQTVTAKAITKDLLSSASYYEITLDATCNTTYHGSSSSSKTIKVNQPYVGPWVYNASGTGTNKSVIAQTKAHNTVTGATTTVSYGNPGTNNAVIGSAATLSTDNVLYHSDLNMFAKPSLVSTDSTYIKRPGYTFKYFNTSSTDGNNTNRYYLINKDGAMFIDETETYVDGVDVNTTTATGTTGKNLYGWWEPDKHTVTYLNADGTQLWQNDIQPYDHKAYYGGDTPLYSANGSLKYTFAGWINMNTGELITTATGSDSTSSSKGLLPNSKNGTAQYIYEDTTYMAYYTASSADGKSYTVNFDYNGDGTIDTANGDITSTGTNRYYKKIYRELDNVPYLQGEVFGPTEWYKWVDTTITCVRGSVVYDDNSITVTALGSETNNIDAYTSETIRFAVEPNTTYTMSAFIEDLTPSGMTGDVEIFRLYYPATTAGYSSANSMSIPKSKFGSVEAEFTTPANCNYVSFRLDANNTGNVIKFSDLHVTCKSKSYAKESTAEYDYSEPVWVNAADGTALEADTRITTTPMTYKVKFAETPINYSLTLITGSSNSNVSLSGGQYVTNASTGEKDVATHYTWDSVITLPNPGDFADGVYNYQFVGWKDADNTSNPLRNAGYTLVKNANALYADEYIRADGNAFIDPKTCAHETDMKSTKTFVAVYTRTAKTYEVKFIDDNGEDMTSYSWSGEYLTKLPVTAPANQTREDTDRYTYTFLGWDNTKTKAVENLSAAEINTMYSNAGVTADATYKPVFDGTYHYYVTFVNEDGSAIEGFVPETKWYTEGQKILSNELPNVNLLKKPADTQIYTYDISGWETNAGAVLVPGTTTVTGDITYKVKLTQVLQRYDVKFYDEDGTTLAGTVKDVEYGSRAETGIPTMTKEHTKYYSYTFAGWDNMDTPNVVERLSNSELEIVNGEQRYRAVYKQTKYGYEIQFKVPSVNTFVTGTVPSITQSDYVDYTWTDSGVNYGNSATGSTWPAYYYNERVSAPVVVPTISVSEITAQYKAQFVGWYSEQGGKGELLSLATRIDDDPVQTYYAYFEPIGVEYNIQFFENTTAVAPFYAATVNYGDNASTIADARAAVLKTYNDDDYHYTFDKWVLEDGTAAASAIANVTGELKVYATFKSDKHTLSDFTTTTAATYYQAGEKTRTCTCDGCKYVETAVIERLKDTTAPTGQILVKEAQNDEAIAKSNTFITDFTGANTAYASVEKIDVMINTNDIGLGVDKLYYAIVKIENGDEYLTLDAVKETIENPTALAAAIKKGSVVEANTINDHFTVSGKDGDKYVIYAAFCDKAINWTEVDDKGEPVTTTIEAATHYVYISGKQIVFDVDSPVIEVTNEDNYNNTDKTAFCEKADIAVADTFLKAVTVKNGDTKVDEKPEITTGEYAYTVIEYGEYTVIATDITGKVTEYTFILDADHDYDEGVLTEAKCEQNAYTTYTCSICGHKNVVDVTNTVLTHDYQEVIVKAATCEEAGSKKTVCSLCGDETEPEEISAIGHKYNDGTNDTEDTPNEVIAATCADNGKKIYICENDSTHIKVVPIPATGHTYDDGTYVEATCTEGAYTKKICSKCGDVQILPDVEHPKLNHNMNDGEVDYAATCDHTGIMKFSCSRCDYATYEVINAIGHKYEETVVKQATCCTTGLKQNVCSACGSVQPESDVVIEKIDHQYGEWIIDTPATCTTVGSKHRDCKYVAACGKTETVEISALAHKLANGKDAYVFDHTVAPTATEGGYDVYICSLCGDEQHKNPTPSLGTYNITVYDENGTTVLGNVGGTGGDKITAEQISAAVIAQKTGYTFSKWVDMEGTEIEFPITLTVDTAVKASYTINEYAITWMNESTLVGTTNVNYNEAVTAIGTVPEKAADVNYTYEFKGWTETAGGKIIDKTAFDASMIIDFTGVVATADKTYYAVYTRDGTKFEIVWKDWNGEELAKTYEAYNTVPEAPEVTINDEDLGNFIRTWTGEWNPQIRLVNGDAVYTAVYRDDYKFVNIYYYRDGATAADLADTSKAYASETYAAGSTFILPTTGPVKNATEQYTYQFKEWAAVKDQTATAPESGAALVPASDGYKYIATYTETAIKYEVKFLDSDGEEIEAATQTLLFGNEITKPTAPEKAVPEEDTGKYTYEFAGWKYKGTTYDDALPTVTGDMTFEPVFNKIYNTAKVTFYSFDGKSIYKETTVNLTDKISYSGKTPMISRDAQYTYKWIGWNVEPESETTVDFGNAEITNAAYVDEETGFVFYAAFEKTVRKYDVKWVVNGKTFTQKLDYGTQIEYPEGEEGVPSIENFDTDYRAYTFVGWSATEGATEADVTVFPTVTGNVTYYAVFTSVINTVDVKWVNYDGTELDKANINYGEVPVFTKETPEKVSDEPDAYSWKFVGWKDENDKTYAPDASFGRVTTDKVYTAQFEKANALYTVTFYGKDGEELSKKADYEYDNDVIVPADLAGYNDDSFAYTFKGWTVTVGGQIVEDITTATLVDFTTVKVTANAAYYPVFLKVAREQFKVTFDAQNGTTAVETSYYTNDKVIVPEAPEKASDDGFGGADYEYEFIGWATTASGVDDENVSTIITIFPLVTQAVTYYAQYNRVEKSYWVKFLDEYGYVIEQGSYGYNDKAQSPAVSGYETRQRSYSFNGWAATKDGEQLYAPNAEITVTSNITVYAIYTSTSKLFKVTFKYYNGTDEVTKTEDAYYGDKVYLPTPGEREADNYNTYTFEDWTPIPPTYTDEIGEYIYATATKTYTAVYTTVAKTYKIFFYDLAKDENGELTQDINKTVFSAKTDYTYNQAITLPKVPANFETNCNEYTFKGWAKVNDTENAIIDFAADAYKTVTKNASFKAVYEKAEKKYSVIFKNYDGTVISEFIDKPYGTAITVPDNASRDDETYTYTFNGWSDGKNLIQSSEIPTTIVANMTYFADYTKEFKNYVVKFFAEDGITEIKTKSSVYHYGDSVVVPSAPNKNVEGYTYEFVGWRDMATDGQLYESGYIPSVKNNTNYKAEYTGGANTYKLQFIIDGVITLKEYTHNQAIGSLSDIVPVKATDNSYTYEFIGWALTDGGAVKYADTAAIEAATPTITKAANYYAIFNPVEKTYKVSFYDENGTLITSKDYKFNETLEVPADRVKDGIAGQYKYEFLGWTSVKDDVSKVANLKNSLVKDNAEYYAIFNKIESLYSAFFHNGSTICAKYVKVAYGTDISKTLEPTKASVKYIGTGEKETNDVLGVEYETKYTFSGWATSADGEAVYKKSALLPAITADVDYYAVFTDVTSVYVPQFTIKFIVSGKEVSNKLYDINSAVTVPTTGIDREPDKNNHYVFTGWSVNSDGSGTAIESANIPVATKDITYYAVYTAIKHSLSESTNSSETYKCSPDGTSKTTWVCSGCDYKKVETGVAHHNYVETHKKAATYRFDGTSYLTCTGCGDSKTEVISKLGRPVDVSITDSEGNPINGAKVTIYMNGEAIDSATTNASGIATVYVPGDGSYNIVVEAAGLGTTTGSITVSGDKVTNNFSPFVRNICNCTCHKDTFWAKIYKVLYKVLNSMFKAKCCDDQNYLGR